MKQGRGPCSVPSRGSSVRAGNPAAFRIVEFPKLESCSAVRILGFNSSALQPPEVVFPPECRWYFEVQIVHMARTARCSLAVRGYAGRTVFVVVVVALH